MSLFLLCIDLAIFIYVPDGVNINVLDSVPMHWLLAVEQVTWYVAKLEFAGVFWESVPNAMICIQFIAVTCNSVLLARE